MCKQDSEFEEMDSTVELERGQNIFEIHIDKVHYGTVDSVWNCPKCFG